MIDQHQDDVVSAYRAGIKELAEEYDAGAISENKVWQEMCKKKKMIFPAIDSRQVKSLEVRVVTYLMSLNFVDEVLKKDIQKLQKSVAEETNVDSFEMLPKLEIKAFDFLDYLLKNGKVIGKYQGILLCVHILIIKCWIY